MSAKLSSKAVAISLSVWGDKPDLGSNKGTIAGFQKVQPGVTVTPIQWTAGPKYYEQLVVDIAGGTVPDMVYFQGWEWQAYAIDGNMVDLDPYIDRDRGALPSDLFPAVDAYVRQLSLQGKHYGMPYDSGSMVMFYNKDLFKAAGVPYPKDGWTLNDFLTTVQQLQAGLSERKGVFAYQPNYGAEYYRNFPWWRMQGGLEFDRLEEPTKAQWTAPVIGQALQQQLYDLPTKGGAMPPTAKGGGIEHGLAAMKVEGPWFLPSMWGPQAAVKGGMSFDVVHMPKGSSGYSMSWNVDPITIWKASKHPDECWAYLKFAVSDAGQQPVADGGRMTGIGSSIIKLWAPTAQKLYNFQNTQAFAFDQGASVVQTGGVDVNLIQSKGGLDAATAAIAKGARPTQEAMQEVEQLTQSLLDAWWKQYPTGTKR